MDFNQEKKLFKLGYKKILAIDESGRGALAGPLVVSGVVIEKQTLKLFNSIKKIIKDSKKLSPRQRMKIFNLIQELKIPYRITKITPQVIDKIGIHQAFFLGVKRLIHYYKNETDLVLIDGPWQIKTYLPVLSFVKGDEKIFSIALASIIAKVKRDLIMIKLNHQYPHFNLNIHKGYGTVFHRQALKKYGPVKIHRRTFIKFLTKVK